jgi:hypothetical protein
VRVSQCKELADSNAFAILMSSRKVNDAWEEAETADDSRFRPTKANGGRRKTPFHQGHARHANRRRYFLLWCDPLRDIVFLDVRVLIVKSGMLMNLTLLPGMRIQTTIRAFR